MAKNTQMLPMLIFTLSSICQLNTSCVNNGNCHCSHHIKYQVVLLPPNTPWYVQGTQLDKCKVFNISLKELYNCDMLKLL